LSNGIFVILTAVFTAPKPLRFLKMPGFRHSGAICGEQMFEKLF
jgi:hypothetical protein